MEEKEAQIIKVNIKLRMHKWPARQYMDENSINDKYGILIKNNLLIVFKKLLNF